MKKGVLQKDIFPELSEVESRIVELLRKDEDTAIDELNMRSGFSSSSIAAALLNLEVQGILKVLPGKRFRLYD
jgi:DNA processing protein